MNICHISPHYLPSFAGLTTVFRETAAYELRQGHRVSVVCYFPWKPWKLTDVARETIEGVSVIRLKNHILSGGNPVIGRFLLRFVLPLRFFNAMRSVPCDVLHIAGITHLTYASILYAKLKKKKTVISLYGEELRMFEEPKTGLARIRQRLRFRLNSRVYRSADAVTCSSRSLIDGLREFGIRDDAKLVYNGVNVDKFSLPDDTTVAYAKKRYTIPDDKIILGSVGGISHRKGYDILLDVFAKVYSADRQFHLVIVGGGDIASLEQLADNLGVRGAVTFLGALSYEQLVEVYPLMDIYVQLPRFEEGVSQTALEAAMFEKPVILSDCGAMRDSVADGVSGYIVPIDDPQGIARRIVSLAQNPDQLKKMGKAGRKWVAENRSYATIAQEYLNVFNELCAGT